MVAYAEENQIQLSTGHPTGQAAKDPKTIELIKIVLNALKATTKTVELLLKSSKVK